MPRPYSRRAASSAARVSFDAACQSESRSRSNSSRSCQRILTNWVPAAVSRLASEESASWAPLSHSRSRRHATRLSSDSRPRPEDANGVRITRENPRRVSRPRPAWDRRTVAARTVYGDVEGRGPWHIAVELRATLGAMAAQFRPVPNERRIEIRKPSPTPGPTGRRCEGASGTLRRTDPEHRDRSDTHVSVGGIGVRRGRRRLND